MMVRKSAVLVAVLVAVFSAVLVPTSSAGMSDAAVSDSDIGISNTVENVYVSAGSTCRIDIVIVNNLPYQANSIANERVITLSTNDTKYLTMNISDSFIILEGQKHKTVGITLAADLYASTGKTDAVLTLTVKPMDSSDVTTGKINYVIHVNIDSPLSSATSFNNILEVFPNPFPAPFNTPLASAFITFILWIIIGSIALALVTPIIFRIMSRGSKEKKNIPKKGIKKLMMAMVVMFALGSCMKVYGASEALIATVTAWTSMLYVLLGAIVAWRLYKTFQAITFDRINDSLAEDGITDFNSNNDLEPLLDLIGKITITVVALAIILARFGIDVGAIITSAGLVSLGITYGASSVLNQFFSGMVLLITRPFKAGDIVQIGADSSSMYEVVKVKVMNTVFESFINEDVIIMPNNAVSSATIVNVTGKGLVRKIQVYVGVAYGENLDKAKRIMVDIANNYPTTIINEQYDAPYVSVTDLKDSCVELRLTMYVRDVNDAGKNASHVREAIYKKFTAEGITIPFPQMDVHISGAETGKKA